MDEQGLSFGPFMLIPGQRKLIRNGTPVRLGSRAFDILLALAERAGEIISKDELMAVAWPNLFVEESNLRVHMVSLRKALDDDGHSPSFVANVPGRGYCFVAPVLRRSLPGTLAAELRAASPEAPAPPPVRPTAPSTANKIIGREAAVQAVVDQLPLRRLVSIVGPGGIGKTTVALSAMEALASRYADGAIFLDLSPINDPCLLPSALASALKHVGHASASIDELVSFLRARETLLVLDSCEQIVEAVATLAESLLDGSPNLHVLTTSREPLRSVGEWVQRLPPLEVPPRSETISARQAMGFSSVRLFVARASECLGGYELTDDDAPAVAELCRRLDGIALAIELAAGRVDMIGIRGLAASLDDCFRVLTRGRRTALPRHQTLRATLDWSYCILSPDEQRAFRRLSLFNGGFDLLAARALGPGDEAPFDLDEAVAGLVAKSLVAAEISQDGARYRLLETTRVYGLEKLREAGEELRFAALHAHYFEARFRRAACEWETTPTRCWVETYAGDIGNLRAALDWSFAQADMRRVGVSLTVSAIPLWFQLSLVEECLQRVRVAISILGETSVEDGQWRMRLYAALGWPQMRGFGNVPTGSAAWRATLEIADEMGDLDFQSRSLWALWVDRSNAGEPEAALALADRFCALTGGSVDNADESIGWRMRARSLHLLGSHMEARRNVERMLAVYVAPPVRSHLVRFQYEQRITARITRGRTLWLLGFAEQAFDDIRENIEAALAYGHVPTLCHALSDSACPIALLAGQLDLAEHYIALQSSHTAASTFDVWHTHGLCYAGELLIQRGEVETGLSALRAGMTKLAQSGFVLYQTVFLGACAQGLLQDGRVQDAMDSVECAFAQCRRTGEAWFLPELHRIRGEILLRSDQSDTLAAETSFLDGLKLAQEQGSLSFALRSATSLAHLRRNQGRHMESRAIVEPVLERFTEGFDTPDVQAAQALLDG